MKGRSIILALGLAGTTAAHASDAPVTDGRPAILREVAYEQRLNQQVPLDAVFRDENGREVRLGQYFGSKPVILTLVYYECPMLCTVILNGLVQSLERLTFDAGKEFEIVTVSFNPTETPTLAAAKKENYLERYDRAGAAAGWHFLTGDEASIRRVTEAVGFRYAYDPERKEYAHAAGIVVLTPTGRISRYFYGVEFPPRDLRLGLVEAAESKIGSAVDQLLLYCYHYDPKTGKYGAAVMNVMRLGGLLTVLLLAAFVVLSRLREHRAKARLSLPSPPTGAFPPHGVAQR